LESLLRILSNKNNNPNKSNENLSILNFEKSHESFDTVCQISRYPKCTVHTYPQQAVRYTHPQCTSTLVKANEFRRIHKKCLDIEPKIAAPNFHFLLTMSPMPLWCQTRLRTSGNETVMVRPTNNLDMTGRKKLNPVTVSVSIRTVRYFGPVRV